MFPPCGFVFDEAPRKIRNRVRFYLEGVQKARRDFEHHSEGFRTTPQYSVTDTFPRYISLPRKPNKNLQEKKREVKLFIL